MFLLPRMEGRIFLSGLARQVSVLGAEKRAGSDNFCCGVRSGAKDLTRLGEEQRMRSGEKPGTSAQVGRELSPKERERTGELSKYR